MTTFSQLVDKVVAEVGRPDLRNHASAYLTQTIRECHIDPERNTALFLWPNYRETTVVADSEQAFAWPIPDTTRFQGESEIRYDSVWQDGNPVYPLPHIPGRVGATQRFAYHKVGDRIIFKGYGGLNATISIAWFEFPRGLKYYAPGARPAEWDDADGYTYADGITTPEQEEEARLATTNWLLERWDMVLEEGVRAKIYKRLSDTERARTSYSLYMQLRLGLQTSEGADLAGVR